MRRATIDDIPALCASEMGKTVYRRLGFREKDGWMELDL